MAKTNIYIDQFKEDFDKALDFFKDELKKLRTGRATPSLIEGILVESYGVKTPLKQLANMSIPDNKTIGVEPWDKNVLKEIESAIAEANLGVTTVNNGQQVLVKLPQMTEENRKDIVKVLGQKAEDVRIKIRQVREKVKDEILQAEEKKEIAEDEKYNYVEELEVYVKELNNEIETIREKKETEIMTI